MKGSSVPLNEILFVFWVKKLKNKNNKQYKKFGERKNDFVKASIIVSYFNLFTICC